MTKFERMVEQEDDGWTEWIHPLPGYKLACCDCGLVHDFEFRLDDENKLNFRARRNKRSTGQMRRVRPGKAKTTRQLAEAIKESNAST